MRTVAIVQSSYIPWRGYFDLIRRSDIFVFLDSVQFTRRDWRTRNAVKTAQGLQWLSVPVSVANHLEVPISEVMIDHSQPWARTHLRTMAHAYARAPHRDEIYPWLEKHLAEPVERLVQLNRCLIRDLWHLLSGDQHREFVGDENFELPADSNGRLIAICRSLGATRYLSGPSARDYLDPERWREATIDIEFLDYHYAPYPQLHGSFETFVSVVDVLMNLGPGSLEQALQPG